MFDLKRKRSYNMNDLGKVMLFICSCHVFRKLTVLTGVEQIQTLTLTLCCKQAHTYTK